MIPKLFGALITLVAVVGGCGMFVGRAVQHSTLPKYALVQPDNQELGITQPLTQPLKVSMTLAPVEDDRDERAQVIWRVTFALALVLILAFLVTAALMSLSVG